MTSRCARGPATVTLYPAGHMLGSAQLLFEHQDTRVLYTGDIKLRQPGGTRTHVPKAHVLVLESTYGGRTSASGTPTPRSKRSRAGAASRSTAA
jgi:Cft2 family RNA processing exonuclease